MKQTKTPAISIIAAVILSLTSCSTTKNIQNVQKGTTVYKDFYSYYVNDSLSFSYRFAGCCYKEIVNKKEIKKNLKKFDKNLSFNHCLACFQEVGEWDKMDLVFYFPHKKNTSNKLLSAIRKSSENIYIDENKQIVGKYIPLENNKGSIYFLRHTSNDHYQTFYAIKKELIDSFYWFKTNEQYRNIEFSSPFDIARNLEILEDTTINYLMPVYVLKKREPNYTDPSSKWLWLQAYATHASRLTSEYFNPQNTTDQWRNTGRTVDSENSLATDDATLSYLIQKCKDERVVMINESHHHPNTRILAEMLLDSLYDCGFRYLGMEAIWENDAVLNQRGFAVTHTGYYSREPMMANVIRKAIEKGFYVFGYDDYTNDREKNQALNIYQKTFAEDSLAKVLIWAGHGHINKAEGPKAWMAREFFLLTGIDPLTINQTDYATEENEYLTILDTAFLKNRRNICDIYLANNINYELFAEKSGYKNYEISIPTGIAEQTSNQSLMFLVSIYRVEEYQKDKTAIPIYNYMLNNGLAEISIRLPKNKYFYLIRNVYGEVLSFGDF
jgi:hypothetical protein